MVAIPESTKVSLQQRLTRHAKARWPALAGIEVRYRAGFAYVDADLPDGDRIPLMRLRYQHSAHLWGFAIYLASRDGYQEHLDRRASTIPKLTVRVRFSSPAPRSRPWPGRKS